MTAADWVAIIMVIALTLYAWSGIADFGAGFWDLTAGGRTRGRGVRALIDEVVTPVWEVNHVWLIFLLITFWTGFGAAFGPVMTTLFVPLSLAALGIVLRGANFALRKDAARAGGRHVTAWLFGLGAIITPFFFGAALAGIVDGRVPPDGTGDPVSSWWNGFSIAVGLLVVAMGAFLSATYLVVEAARRGLTQLRAYFQKRALAAGVVGLLCGGAAAITLHIDSPPMFHRFVHRSIPLLIIGLAALVATFVGAIRGLVHGVRLRVVAALGVAALVWAWAVAQYDYLLPFTMTIAQGAGADVTMRWLIGWALVALVTVVPLLILLYVLDQRGELGEDPTTSAVQSPPV